VRAIEKKKQLSPVTLKRGKRTTSNENRKEPPSIGDDVKESREQRFTNASSRKTEELTGKKHPKLIERGKEGGGG